MDNSWLERSTLLIAQEGIQRLNESHVLIVGLGGVGSYAAEAIARAGVGKITILDGDVVDPTNRNRQLQALATTHGQSKALLMEDRIRQINPSVSLVVKDQFLDVAGAKAAVQAEKYNYVIDAIDSITPKVNLMATCYWNDIPLISSMGAGGRMDPSKIVIGDLKNTYNCFLAQVVRKRLIKHNVYGGIKVVWSKEEVYKKSLMYTQSRFKKSAYGTISYIPAMFGMTCASVVIRDLSGWSQQQKLKAEKKKRRDAKKKDEQ
jgi:tRNA threonylcarbamoyladenosine dehydratase